MPNICEICDSNEFENLDGFYYCIVCGTKSLSKQDIELNDEEFVGGTVRIDETFKVGKQSKKDILDEKNSSVDTIFSTFHVFNHIIKAQVDDLVNLGCNSMIKHVVFELWAKYLQKLEIAFNQDDIDYFNESNVKWHRDKQLFEKLKLINDSSQVETVKNDDDKHVSSAEQAEIQSPNEQSDADEEFHTNIEEGLDESRQKTRTKPLLTNFHLIRMPHTIVLLNLGLLIIKSNFLLTDLLRFVNKGKLSYSNVNKILPKTMSFRYNEDSIMFNSQGLPKANYLRYLTGKLGQFLKLGEIDLIDIRHICCRFIFDLNLPYELNGLVNGLMENLKKRNHKIPSKCNFKHSQNLNLEAHALSCILVVMATVFLYDGQTELKTELIDEKYNEVDDEIKRFSFNQWFNCMQNILTTIQHFVFGIDVRHVKSMDDMDYLNFSKIDFRYNNETYPFVCQYRQKELLETLALPLIQDEKAEENNGVQHKPTNSLLFIGNLYKTKNGKQMMDMRCKTIDHLINENKIEFLVHRSHVDLHNIQDYFKEIIVNKQLDFKYKMGLNLNKFNWLLCVFEQLSQTPNIHSTLCKLTNKLMSN